jgi:hypothetical protein
LLVTADVFTALVESLPDNVCDRLQVLLVDICRCIHLQKKARAMVRWDAGFMLSNGRPLLDLVRKAKIEPSPLPAGRRPLSAASDVSAVMRCHRLSTGARSPFFCRLRQRDPPTEPEEGVRYPSDPLFLRKFPSHIRMPVTWTTPR